MFYQKSFPFHSFLCDMWCTNLSSKCNVSGLPIKVFLKLKQSLQKQTKLLANKSKRESTKTLEHQGESRNCKWQSSDKVKIK